MRMRDKITDTMSSFETLNQMGLQAFQDALTSWTELLNLSLGTNPLLEKMLAATQHSVCEVPPPCWMPKDLGELRSVVCKGGVAVLQIEVTNCQARNADISVQAESNWPLQIEPERITLGPMERKCIIVRLHAEQDVCKSDCEEVLVWVHGCNSHFLRWQVEVKESDVNSCHKIKVEDCPDYQHHWYDHFYCARPCFRRDQRG